MATIVKTRTIPCIEIAEHAFIRKPNSMTHFHRNSNSFRIIYKLILNVHTKCVIPKPNKREKKQTTKKPVTHLPTVEDFYGPHFPMLQRIPSNSRVSFQLNFSPAPIPVSRFVAELPYF